MPVNSQNSLSENHEAMLAWVSLIHTSNFLREGLEDTLKDQLNITLPEQDLLKQLSVNGDDLTLTELAERIYLSKAGMTKMLDRLEKQGLVKRRTVPGNRRTMRATLTKKGRSSLDKSRDILLAYVSENFDIHLSKTELANLSNALKRILEGHGRWEGQISHLKGQS
jgi:DNA-binding MarR family transcriptional regulator